MSDLSSSTTDSYKNLTGNYTKVSDYKRRLSKPGRKTAKSGYKPKEYYEYGASSDLCGCAICVQKLPLPIVIFYGFAENECSNVIRKLQK